MEAIEDYFCTHISSFLMNAGLYKLVWCEGNASLMYGVGNVKNHGRNLS